MRGFAPDGIRRAAKEGTSHGTLIAATLYLDIKGFSAMTESLMQQEKEGAEVLSKVMDGIFSPAIAFVYEQGGFVASFEGDAFCGVFPEDAAASAWIAACRLLEFFKEHRVETPWGSFSLGVCMGLGYGEVGFRLLPSYEETSFYFYGSAMEGAASAQTRAKTMEILATQDFLEFFPRRLPMTPLDDSFAILRVEEVYEKPQIQNKEETPEDIRFVPKAIRGFREQGEFREITACFLSFSLEGDYLQAIRKVWSLAESFGGFFNKVTFGDKGPVMLLLFGAPKGIEKLARKTVDFAHAVKQIPDFVFRMGVTQGVSFVGFMGSDLRREYTALSNRVNLASRLMVECPYGEVLLDSSLKEALAERYQFVKEGSLVFKGFTKPEDFYRLGEPLGVKLLGESRHFFGRASELAFLKEKIQPLFSGEFGGVVYVDGGPGIGKSSFLSHFIKENREIPFFVLPCDEVLRQSFNPFSHFFRAFFNQSPKGSKEENKRAFEKKYEELVEKLQEEQLLREVRRAKSFLGALFHLEWENSLYEQSNPNQRHEKMIDAVRSFFFAQSTLHPFVIVIEDGHYLDEESLGLLQMLLRTGSMRPFLVLISCRPYDDGTLFRGVDLGEKNTSAITLKGLEEDAMKALVNQVLKVKIPPKTWEFIWEKSMGNPFFGEQMALYLKEQGLLDAKGEHLYATIPHAISQIIVARIDRLTHEMKDVIKAASVLGREFALQALQALVKQVYDMGPTVSQDTFARITKEQVWEALSAFRYIFKHALIRDTVYGMQLQDTLKKLHGAAGLVIEKLSREDPKAFYEELAEHFFRADNKEKAIEYLELAVYQAKENYQNGKALRLNQRLLGLLGDGRKKVEALLTQAFVYTVIADWDRSLLCYEEALALSHTLGEKTLRIQSLLGIAGNKRVKGDLMGALHLFSTIREEAHAISYKKGAYDAITGIARIHYLKSHFDQALLLLPDLILGFTELEDRPSVAQILILRANIHFFRGDQETALKDFQEVLELYEELEDKLGIGQAVAGMSSVYSSRSQHEKALAGFQKAFALCEELGCKRFISNLTVNMGLSYQELGNYTEALRYLHRYLVLQQEINLKGGISFAHSSLGILYALQGDFAKALDAFGISLDIALEQGDLQGLSHGCFYLGRVYASMKETEKAHAYYRQALDLARSFGYARMLVPPLVYQALLFFEEGCLEEAEKANAKAYEHALEQGMSEELFLATTLKHTLAKDVSALSSMLQDATLSIKQRALLNLTAFRLTKDQGFKQSAKEHYRELLQITPQNREYQEASRELSKE